LAITAPTLWLDGEMIASKGASIPLMGHAAQRGSLVFDVGSFASGVGAAAKRGPALFRARDHVARFVRSAQLVGLEIPFDEEILLGAAIDVVAASAHDAGLIRWSAFYAAPEPDLVPRDPTTRVAVAAQFLQDPPKRDPLRIAVFDDAHKSPPEVLPVEAKAAAAYLGPMIARKRAIASGADDVVLLDGGDGQHLAEAPIANVFAVVSGTLWTPPLGRILPGITRQTVLTLARAEGIAIREEPVSVDRFRGADEAFLTATSFPIAPIGSINGHALATATKPGPITERLIDRIRAARRGEDRDPEHEAWLTYVRAS
jgi:branched-chain amino acid aminotransferase